MTDLNDMKNFQLRKITLFLKYLAFLLKLYPFLEQYRSYKWSKILTGSLSVFLGTHMLYTFSSKRPYPVKLVYFANMISNKKKKKVYIRGWEWIRPLGLCQRSYSVFWRISNKTWILCILKVSGPIRSFDRSVQRCFRYIKMHFCKYMTITLSYLMLIGGGPHVMRRRVQNVLENGMFKDSWPQKFFFWEKQSLENYQLLLRPRLQVYPSKL